jgi:hypothetical protein
MTLCRLMTQSGHLLEDGERSFQGARAGPICGARTGLAMP